MSYYSESYPDLQEEKKIVWIYYETDGDAGYFNIRLFSTRELAIRYKEIKKDAYGNIIEIEIDRKEEEGMSFKYEETLCPDCNGQMISRTGQYGTFWGCKNYPKCKGTRDSQGRSKADREKWKKEQAGEDYESDTKDETNKFSFKRIR